MTKNHHLDELAQTKLACECYVLHDNKVLLFKRDPKARSFPGWWIGPGGHIDATEDALTGAVRELFEEAGIKVRKSDTKLKAVSASHHLDREELWISFIFLATIPASQKVTEANIEGKAAWIPLGKLASMKNVFPPAKYYFDHVLNDRPGVLYTNIKWKNAQLVKVHSHQIG